ncbi:hypothetical protein [Dyadobacter psychrophilus]|uniref:Uncharacterized protein n=1 Tax=Dyadobacter psychrophilus TaxID=651661 RepID=A0A1T5G7K3_9BACT|nr:hypothetical protein [Dyadobacter psychrophilus]SKC04440.1 hypothetical protein SAMN05660293_03763 [Dyadobacter psychrophilus]
MSSNLEEKRRELFELHKAKLGADAPLMRKPVEKVVVEKKVEQPKAPISKRDKIKYAIFAVTGIIVVIELLFLAREAGWLK